MLRERVRQRLELRFHIFSQRRRDSRARSEEARTIVERLLDYFICRGVATYRQLIVLFRRQLAISGILNEFVSSREGKLGLGKPCVLP